MIIYYYNVTSGTKNGGIETFTRQLAKTTLKNHPQHKIQIICAKEPSFQPELPELHKRFFYINRRRFPGFGKRFAKMMERLSLIPNVIKHFNKTPPDIIQINKPYDFIAAFIFKKLYKCKIVFRSGGTDFFLGDKIFKNTIDGWIANCKNNAKELSQHYNITPDIIFNGVDTNIFKPSQNETNIRTKLNISNDEIVLITVGRLVGWKAHKYLLDAMAICTQTIPTLKLFILGDGPEKANLQQQAIDLKLQNNIFFNGDTTHSELLKFHKIADIFCITSLEDENCSNALLEAISSGLAIIGSNGGAIPEVINDAGLITPMRDANALANAIKKLSLDLTLRQKLNQKARARALQYLDINKISEQYLQYYQNLLDKN